MLHDVDLDACGDEGVIAHRCLQRKRAEQSPAPPTGPSEDGEYFLALLADLQLAAPHVGQTHLELLVPAAPRRPEEPLHPVEERFDH